jgi:site-specific recombinase XerD
MPKRTTISLREVAIGGQPFWQVTTPRTDGTPGRVRRTFKSKKEAQGYLSSIKITVEKYGFEAGLLSAELRLQAIEASRILEPTGATLIEAVRQYVSRHAIESRTVKQATEEFIAVSRLDGRKPRYLRSIKQILGAFSAGFADRRMTDLGVSDVANWLYGLQVGAVTRNTYRRTLHTLFAFALSRKWATENPVAAINKAKEPHSPIGILTVEQMRALLEAATPELLPYCAIGGFTGLRTSELVELDWNEVHFDSRLVEVTAAKAKTSRRRFIDIQPNLAEWLRPYVGRTGPVVPRRAFKYELARAIARAGITQWPSNALRHSFASNHLARFQNASKLALELGHSTTALIFSNYRELVKPAEAERWWAIRPQG